MKVQPVPFHLSKRTQNLINTITNPNYKAPEIVKQSTKKSNLPKDFHLSNNTRQMIEKVTKLSFDEMKNLDPQEARDLMIQRGVIKKPNPVKEFFKNVYKKFGEKFGLLEKPRPYIYTDID